MATTCEVTHRLRLRQMVCTECAEIITEGLTALNGVILVNADWRTSSVTIRYDLHRVRLEMLEKLLTEIGFPPDPGRLHRWQRTWIRFRDQNTLDHHKHQGVCCSRPPR